DLLQTPSIDIASQESTSPGALKDELETSPNGSKSTSPGAPVARRHEQSNDLRQSSGQSETFTFLFVGKGYRKKGLDVLLRACKILKQEQRNFQLQVAGLKEKPIDSLRLSRLGLANTVHFLGFRKDMDSVYSNADAVILPSRVEPFGMAPVQAMSYGLAAIVSANCGVSELLRDQEDCLILDNHLSPEELASHMKSLMDDRTLLEKLSRNGRKTAAKASWNSTVEATINAYARILDSSNKVGKLRQTNLGHPLPLP
ncbi:MAG: glycosyltransferase family 4 protein, partial [Cyanobacteria bacterium]|nr:glycosyltransferase family 4 protein [Cyanobacteriota bacterium]